MLQKIYEKNLTQGNWESVCVCEGNYRIFLFSKTKDKGIPYEPCTMIEKFIS